MRMPKSRDIIMFAHNEKWELIFSNTVIGGHVRVEELSSAENHDLHE